MKMRKTAYLLSPCYQYGFVLYDTSCFFSQMVWLLNLIKPNLQQLFSIGKYCFCFKAPEFCWIFFTIILICLVTDSMWRITNTKTSCKILSYICYHFSGVKSSDPKTAVGYMLLKQLVKPEAGYWIAQDSVWEWFRLPSCSFDTCHM